MRIVVIGAGVIGLSIAWQVHRRGAQVVVIDPAPAQGATRAAAGMLAPTAEACHGEDALTALLVWSARRYPAFVADVEAATGRPAGHLRTTTLVCAADAADRASLTDLHTLHTRLGLASEPLTVRQARALEPLLAPTLAGAYLMVDDHQIDPRVLTRALLSGLAEVVAQPAVAVEHTDPTDLASAVTGVRLADDTVLSADAVVVANAVGAAYLAGLPIDLRSLLRPVHGDILRLTPPTTRWASTLTCTVRALVGGHPVYAVPRADGSVVVGATSREDGQPEVNVGGVHHLLRDAIRVVPALADHGLAETMARPRPGTPDNAPLLGMLAPGLMLATGFFRHGVVLAPLAAAATCHYLLGDSSDSAPPGGATADSAPSGGATSGTAPSGGARSDAAPSGGARSDAAPSGGARSDAAPSGGARSDTAPSGGATSGTAPPGRATSGGPPNNLPDPPDLFDMSYPISSAGLPDIAGLQPARFETSTLAKVLT